MKKKIKEQKLYNYTTRKSNVINVSLIYPNSYYVGMSNIGFHSIYHLLNLNEDINLSRFFFSQSSQNKLYSPDKAFNLNQSDVILLSQSFELDCLNFINILTHNNINPLKTKRKETAPLILAGGIFPTINPEIYYDIVDAVFFGEIEAYSDFFLQSIRSVKTVCKENICRDVYSYFNYEAGRALLPSVPDITSESIPAHSVIISNDTSFKDYFLVEISRGCKFNCSFCLVTNLYREFRFYSKHQILNLVDKALEYTDKIGLISALTTEHPDLEEIVTEINRRGGLVNFSSLRIEKVDSKMLNLMKLNKQNTLTIAPESASPSIKKVIGKNILDDKIFEVIENSLDYNIKKVKIYFIIGFETETEKDIDKNIEFIKNVREVLLKKAGKTKTMPRIIISVSPFIPKPHTEMKDTKTHTIKEIKRRAYYIKKHILPLGGIDFHLESPQLSHAQKILSKGNKDIGQLLIKIAKEGKSLRYLSK